MNLNQNNNTCPLCHTKANNFYQSKKKFYYLCPNCEGIFLDASLYLNPEDEKDRYLTHDNNVEDERYQNFVQPLVDIALKNFTPQHKGLDFGAGTGPVITKLLNDKGFDVTLYDPYFHPNKKALEQKYDFIVSCEVIEHFQKPHEEFKLLKNLLNPGGLLICKTHPYSPPQDFATWYYKNDPTHVFIYQTQTFHWIQKNMGFKTVEVNDRVIVFGG